MGYSPNYSVIILLDGGIERNISALLEFTMTQRSFVAVVLSPNVNGNLL